MNSEFSTGSDNNGYVERACGMAAFGHHPGAHPIEAVPDVVHHQKVVQILLLVALCPEPRIVAVKTGHVLKRLEHFAVGRPRSVQPA